MDWDIVIDMGKDKITEKDEDKDKDKDNACRTLTRLKLVSSTGKGYLVGLGKINNWVKSTIG